jgi:flavodoxin
MNQRQEPPPVNQLRNIDPGRGKRNRLNIRNK